MSRRNGPSTGAVRGLLLLAAVLTTAFGLVFLAGLQP